MEADSWMRTHRRGLTVHAAVAMIDRKMIAAVAVHLNWCRRSGLPSGKKNQPHEAVGSFPSGKKTGRTRRSAAFHQAKKTSRTRRSAAFHQAKKTGRTGRPVFR